jgi:hypothetical protein
MTRLTEMMADLLSVLLRYLAAQVIKCEHTCLIVDGKVLIFAAFDVLFVVRNTKYNLLSSLHFAEYARIRTGGRDMKLFKIHCAVDATTCFFTNRVIIVWNASHADVVHSKSLSAFKKRLCLCILSDSVSGHIGPSVCFTNK